MKRSILLISLFIFSTLYIYSCMGSIPPLQVATYSFSLDKIENNIGDYNINKLTYTDSCLEIVFYLNVSQLKFSIVNKLDDSLSIIWDDVLYIDVNNKNERVIHTGTKYDERNNPQPPTYISGKGEILEIIIPSSYVNLVTYLDGRETISKWETEPFFSYYLYSENPDELKHQTSLYTGKTFQVFLPIENKRIRNNYIFTIRIDDVSIEISKDKY